MALNPNLNWRQMAIPGMESQSHPWAGRLAQGLGLHFETVARGDGRHHPDEHGLFAYRMGRDDPKGGQTQAELQWIGGPRGGDFPTKHLHYPGHVEWAGNSSSEIANAEQRKPLYPGLAKDVFHAAHTFDFGQDTVPVHSPIRTDEGYAFSQKVMPHLAPPDARDIDPGLSGDSPAYDWEMRRMADARHAWQPPVGLHPYEQQQQKASDERRASRHQEIPGQMSLFEERSGRPTSGRSGIARRSFDAARKHGIATGQLPKGYTGRVPSSVRESFEASRGG